MRSVIALVVCFVLAACGSGPGTGPVASAASTPAGPAPTANAALFADLTAAGLPADDAMFLASTSVEVTSSGPGKATIVEHLLSGDTTEITVTITAATSGTPGLVTSSSTTTADRIEVHLEYLVSAEGISDEVRKSLEGVAAASRLIAAAGDSAPIVTAEVSIYNVVVSWVTSKASSTLRDMSIAALLETVAPGKVGILMKLIKAGFTVDKGLLLGEALDGQLAELEQLLECALHPTNPLTIKLYAQDPAAKDRIVKQIQDARNELVANTIVMQLGVLNSFAAGFGPKWLGYAIGPGTAWSKATLEDLNRQLLAEVRKAVTKCECVGGMSSGNGGTSGGSGGAAGGEGGEGTTSGGSNSGGSGGGSGASAGKTCVFPFKIVGEVTHTIALNGALVFTSHATGVDVGA
jgi:hypothetical protein